MKKSRGLYHVSERRYLKFSSSTFSEILGTLTTLAVHTYRCIAGKKKTLYASPQLENKNVNNMCIGPVCLVSEQKGVKTQPETNMCRVDRLFLYHVTSACVKSDPPPLSLTLAGCLFNLSSERCLISNQNRHHMDLCSA